MNTPLDDPAVEILARLATTADEYTVGLLGAGVVIAHQSCLKLIYVGDSHAFTVADLITSALAHNFLCGAEDGADSEATT